LRPDILLAVDTSAAHCAAALLWGDGRLVTHAEAMEKGQAERLVPMLEEILASAGLVWADLTLLAVGTGPGNFTGIRIAVSLVRGLSLGLHVPAVGVTGFQALAFGQPQPLATLIDAPRGQFYVQHFPDGAPAITDTMPPGARHRADLDAAGFVGAIARVAMTLPRDDAPRPAPFYLRGADASPPSDPPPRLLP
jgi:tRNA threonylcarbamoyladenosine biosynthesis protein TsaB